MIFWIIGGYFVGLIVSWAAWAIVTYYYLKHLNYSEYQLILISDRIGSTARSKSRLVEWVRFILWPYGVTQRIIATVKVLRRFREEMG